MCGCSVIRKEKLLTRRSGLLVRDWSNGLLLKKILPGLCPTGQLGRKTIAKYFKYLEDKGLIKEGANENYYYLTTLDAMEANLIEYTTLSKLMNVM